MAKIHVQTLGCRLNQAESERMAQGFRLAGHELVPSAREADVRVVNTCTVTGEAGKKSRKAAKALHAKQRVVVTGCHSEVAPGEFDQADLLVPSADKDELVALTLERLGMDGLALGMDFKKTDAIEIYPLALANTRAFVKIQDGCDLRCSFCLTTVARGASRCRSMQEILEEVQTLTKQGCQEVVLTGVHAGSYEYEGKDLADLMELILQQTEIPRLRLSSLEPWNFKFSWIRLWNDFPGRICRHLHMSLQSGSEGVLRRMRRHYTPLAYQEKIDALHSAVPDMAVTTDIIVGFPGETQEEHEESLSFVRQLGFADAHVFSFSPRPGTDAAQMTDIVKPKEKLLRYQEMREVSKQSRANFLDRFLGRPMTVLWERQQADGHCMGLSDHYVKVYGPPGEVVQNEFSRVIPITRKEDVLFL